jgi:uncharacterized membrane protein YcaP (DUF421 family)
MSSILLIAAAIILLFVLLFAFFLVRGSRRIRQMQQDVFANAVPAEATILSLMRGDFTTGGSFRKLELKLTLRVQHPQLPPYEASTEWLVDELALPQVQPQQVVSVRVNREHPERVYPDVPWAEFSDWIIKRH